MRTAAMVIAVASLVCGGRPGLAAGPEDYFPMGVGYEWKYSTTEISLWSADNRRPARVETTANAYTTEFRCIGRLPMPGGRKAWALHRRVKFNKKTERTYSAKDTATYTDTVYEDQADSLILLWSKRALYRSSTELVLPLRPGLTWNVRAWKPDPKWAKAVRQEPVEVPVGSYARAWRVEDSTVIAGGKIMPARDVRWYVDGVGLVRTERQMIWGGRPRWLLIDELVSVKTRK